MNAEDLQLEVHYFGALQDQAGCQSEQRRSQARTVAELYDELHQAGRLQAGRNGLSVAVNDAFVQWSRPLANGDRVALMPPMAGG